MTIKTLLVAAFASLSLAATAHATVLLTDNFDVVSDKASEFNNTLAATQGGTLAVVNYTWSGVPFDNALQHGNGGQMLMAAAADGGWTSDEYVSLNYNFATSANSLGQALVVSFDYTPGVGLVSSTGTNASNWTTVAIGSAQNVFVNDTANTFSSLFRMNGGTQQFASGASIGGSATIATDASTAVKLVIADATGNGSAFNGNGSQVSMFLNNTLVNTWTLSQMTASDGYISFQAFNASAKYDNLSIVAVPEPGTLAFVGIGGLLAAVALRRRSAFGSPIA